MHIPVEKLSDLSLLALLELEMVEAQLKRLNKLLDLQKAGHLTKSEQIELKTLAHIYEDGIRRKEEARAEAIRRGLIKPDGE
jgi:uncharacterized protein YnzC (UPF0291/DUF896 family)